MPAMARAFWISLFYAMVGMFLVFTHIESSKSDFSKTYGDNVEVIVAKRAINELEMLEDSMFQTVWVPKKFAPASGVPSIESLRGMLALIPIAEGDPITATSVSPPGLNTGMSTVIPANMRAVSVPVNEKSGVANFIKPGDRVDIITRLQSENPEGEKRAQTQTLLQDANVLAVGDQMVGRVRGVLTKDNYNNRAYLESPTDYKYSTVTVEVTPDQAQVLVLALSEGTELYFTLRNRVDRIQSDMPPLTKRDLIGEEKRPGSYIAPLPTAPAVAPSRPTTAQREWIDPLYWGGGVLELF